MSEKLKYVNDHEVVDITAASALSSGDPVLLDDGRVGVVAQMDAVASGELVGMRVEGLYDATSASATTFSLGDPVYWDASANVAVNPGLAMDGDSDFYIGVCVKAKASGDTTVRVSLNTPALLGTMPPFVYEFDCETGVDSDTHVLIPAELNQRGLFITHGFGIVTEVFAGSTEDQGIVTVEDTDGTDLFTLTAADSAADAVNDYLAGHQSQSKASGTAAIIVAAGKGVRGVVTQATSGGSPAGKIKAYVQAIPLV